MVHRKFDGLKFRRTYIGGTKQSETKAFDDAQGIKEDNSDCNWIEYRKIFTQYMDDRLNIILSWKYLMNLISILFASIAPFLLIANIRVAIILVIISFMTFLISKYLNYREKQTLTGYDFSLNIILEEIKKETGFNLSK